MFAAVEIPENFRSAKTGKILEQPVVATCGHNFELDEWLELTDDGASGCCTACHKPLGDIVPRVDQGLKLRISEFKLRNNGTTFTSEEVRDNPLDVASRLLTAQFDQMRVQNPFRAGSANARDFDSVMKDAAEFAKKFGR